MPVFIELTTDPFNALMDKVQEQFSPVRRPLRGIEVKEETFAHIKLVRVDGTVINLISSNTPTGEEPSFTNFLLQSVADTRSERHQLIETFGDTYLLLFGEAPRMLQCSAILMNTLDFNWKAEFTKNYELYLRGTKAIEKGCRTYLFYNDNIVEGYILNAVMQENVNSPHVVSLDFQMFVTKSQSLSFISPEYPIRSDVPDEALHLLTGTQDPSGVISTTEYTQEGYRYWVPQMQNTDRELPLRTYISDNTDEQLRHSNHRAKLGAPSQEDEGWVVALQDVLDDAIEGQDDLKQDIMSEVGKAIENPDPDGVFLTDTDSR